MSRSHTSRSNNFRTSGTVSGISPAPPFSARAWPPGADELQRLCDELAAVTAQLDAAEEGWLRLQAELDEAA